MEIDKLTIDMIVRKLSKRFDSNIGAAYLVGEKDSNYSEIEDVSFPEQKSRENCVEIEEDEQVRELENLHSEKVFDPAHNKFYNKYAVLGVVQYNADYDVSKGTLDKNIFDSIIFMPCIKLIVNRRGEYSLLRNEE